MRANLEPLFLAGMKESDAEQIAWQAKQKRPVRPAEANEVLQLRVDSGAQGLPQARASYVTTLRILMGLVGLVLLVACANVATLLLARAAARQPEIAVRMALGASRGRLIRQLLTESLLLALLGASAGMAFAWWSRDVLLALRPFGTGELVFAPDLDERVLFFTAGVGVLTGLGFGVIPAMRATRINLVERYQGGSRIRGPWRSTAGRILVISQVGLALVLLIGAALFTRTLRNVETADFGFNRSGLLLFRLEATNTNRNWTQLVALYDQINERLAALPGIKRASYSFRPLVGGTKDWAGNAIWVAGRTKPTEAERMGMHWIGPNFLDVVEIPLALGRQFETRDHVPPQAYGVALINEAFARKFFPGESPLGQRFGTTQSAAPRYEIVGVVRDTKWSAWTEPGPAVYVTYFSYYLPSEVNFAVRAAGDPRALGAAIRGAIHKIDPGIPLYDMRTQDEQMGRLFVTERLFAVLSSFVAVLALALAAIGLYGLMAYAVHRRTSEVGLRMALGASRRHVLWMIIREALLLVCLGVLSGIAGAWAASRLIARMVYGVSPVDPVTYGGFALVLIAVALVASLLPARRAARVDPMVALRCE